MVGQKENEIFSTSKFLQSKSNSPVHSPTGTGPGCAQGCSIGSQIRAQRAICGGIDGLWVLCVQGQWFPVTPPLPEWLPLYLSDPTFTWVTPPLPECTLRLRALPVPGQPQAGWSSTHCGSSSVSPSSTPQTSEQPGHVWSLLYWTAQVPTVAVPPLWTTRKSFRSL